MSEFRLLLAASTVSSLGNGVRWIALPLLAAQISADPRAVSLVTAAEQAPFLLFGLLAGVLADRRDRRALMWQADLVRGLIMAAFTVAVLHGTVEIWMVAAIGFLITCGDMINNAAFAGLVPVLVTAERRPKANSRVQIGVLIADPLVGSVLGAVLFGLAAALPFGLDAATFFAAAALVALVPGRFRPQRAARPTIRADLAEGVRFLVRSRPLRQLCLLFAFSQLLGAGLVAILVLYSGRELHLSATGYGLLIASFAVGGVAGALLTPRLAAAIGDRRALLLGIGMCAATTLTMGVTASPTVAAAAVALYGGASSILGLVTTTVRQALVPPELMGRVVSTYQMVVFGVTPLGAIGSGLLAHAAGLRAPFLVASVALVGALGVAAWKIRLPSVSAAEPLL
ncbi:MFS family permease [Allocatelliglobosispora scoriae]|uniref:MFS family permease n=1 Tax=Allocatelliglobosispora scoriae TaxID=643052 RepID=A0A841C184_9ACTN|nr:MFS transporter [Allocatelliglobosispora scoriae]MBB5874124.1 MFS family permease [Allocatelliglobosispora scoriae]